jgi:hypothetical protein
MFAVPGCVGVFNTHPGARGQVVDARTGRPIARCEVIVGGAYDAKVIRTKSDGTFSVGVRRRLGVTLLALAPPGGTIFVVRPGYVTAQRELRPIPPEGPVTSQEDLGVIRLVPLSR